MKRRGTCPGVPMNVSEIKGRVQTNPVSRWTNFVNLTSSSESYSPHSGTKPMLSSRGDA